VAGLAALVIGACESQGDVHRPVLLTVADFQALLDDPKAPEAIVPGWGLPDGIRLDRIIEVGPMGPTLVKRDVYTDGYKSAYLTTEVWAGFDEVWVQPVYVAVTGYPTDTPPTRLVGSAGKWRPIFGVGPDSAFYSPYWQTIYFRIPDDVDIDTIQSVRDVMRHGFDFRPAEGRVMALAPPEVRVPERLLSSMKGEELVGGPTPGGEGVYDGQKMPFLDFGTDTFEWNAALEVDEVPLYVWVTRDASGELHQLDMPTVGGSGPPYSNTFPRVVSGKPKYGSYWRIYTVELQPGWRVFAPDAFTDVRRRLSATPYLYEDPPYAADLQHLDPAAATAYDDWAGRVLRNPDCVKNAKAVNPSNNADDPCEYVDAQASIEALVPRSAIRRTDIVVTCPFITYNFKPIVLP
jgi:hypothetical protein